MSAYKCDRSYTHDQYTMLITELKEDQKGGGAMNDCVFLKLAPKIVSAQDARTIYP